MAISKVLALASALFVGLASAQTPPNTSPCSSVKLPVVYSNYTVVSPPGVFLSKASVASQPTLYAPTSAIPGDSYIVIMMDLFINANGTETTFLHWYQPGLVIDSSSSQLVVSDSSVTYAPYISPGAPPGPAHIYAQYLFLQPTGFALPTCYASIIPEAGREGFDIEEFMNVNGLSDPVAGNYFHAADPSPATTTYAITTTYISTPTACPTAAAGY